MVITTSKGATATGHVVFDGGARPAMPAHPCDCGLHGWGRSDGRVGGAGPAVKEDGTFELKGLSGRRVLRVQRLPPAGR